MKKKLGVILLSALLCLGGGMQAYANEVDSNYDYLIESKFKDINTIKYNFYFDGNKAVYGSSVIADSATKIKIYLELQNKVGSKWVKVKSSSDYKNSRAFAYEDSATINTSATYRAYYEITSYYGNGQSETVSKYKY